MFAVLAVVVVVVEQQGFVKSPSGRQGKVGGTMRVVWVRSGLDALCCLLLTPGHAARNSVCCAIEVDNIQVEGVARWCFDVTCT